MHGTRDRAPTDHGRDPRTAIATPSPGRAGAGGGSAKPRPSSDCGLRYLHQKPPKGPETFEVAPGLLWARVPLPYRLNHVNVWLLRGSDGWTIIDTGTSNTEARAVWEALLGSVLSGAPITGLVATHGHTDHVGLAGWLHEISEGAAFHISLAEWLSAQLRIADAKAPLSGSAIAFLSAHGCDPQTVSSFAEDRRRTHTYLQPLPTQIRRLRDGARLRFGGRQWQVMLCGGHAAEHASFWCAEDKILIAGDQILSKISPMIGVFSAEPEADPLTEYLASLDRFRRLPEDTLVLPSHGMPFFGLHERVAELAAHHEQRLDQLDQLMPSPQTAMQLAYGLFPKAVAEGHGRHAFAETLAHAHSLVTRGRALRSEAEGILRFAQMR